MKRNISKNLAFLSNFGLNVEYAKYAKISTIINIKITITKNII